MKLLITIQGQLNNARAKAEKNGRGHIGFGSGQTFSDEDILASLIFLPFQVVENTGEIATSVV